MLPPPLTPKHPFIASTCAGVNQLFLLELPCASNVVQFESENISKYIVDEHVDAGTLVVWRVVVVVAK